MYLRIQIIRNAFHFFNKNQANLPFEFTAIRWSFIWTQTNWEQANFHPPSKLLFIKKKRVKYNNFLMRRSFNINDALDLLMKVYAPASTIHSLAHITNLPSTLYNFHSTFQNECRRKRELVYSTSSNNKKHSKYIKKWKPRKEKEKCIWTKVAVCVEIFLINFSIITAPRN